MDFARAHAIREPQLSDVRLVLSEAVSNAVVHALRDGREPGTVTVAVSISDAEGYLEIVVSDDGMGLAPRHDSPGLGLGLPIIRRLADGLDHHAPPGGGTELRILFQAPGRCQLPNRSVITPSAPARAAHRHRGEADRRVWSDGNRRHRLRASSARFRAHLGQALTHGSGRLRLEVGG